MACDLVADIQAALIEYGFTPTLCTKLAALNPNTAVYNGPMAATGEFAFYSGDDADLSWIVDWTGVATSAVLRLATESDYLAGNPALLEKACTLTVQGNQLLVSVALTDAETALVPGSATSSPVTALRAQVVLTSGTNVRTIIDARGVCLKKVETPSP